MEYHKGTGKVRITVLLALASFLWAFVINEQVFTEQQQPKSQKGLFEMSLEELMEVKVTLVSGEKEELSEPVGSIYLTDSKVVFCRSLNDGRHCEERSDEAISTIRKSEIATLGCASLAMTGHQITCDRAVGNV
jgi:hypothetical protein